ncbi:MAG: hypothetical protein OEW90_06935 [Betaproteobacteria bacterium]|nr:hypothetical protein [Betaproteobacteria bacterium]MDH4323861.1 hypothetical protein [Betaproteobacteria bacterium]MDH5210943.1 hypothetical protein [Betaproteobacteria bacterium]
MERDRGAGAENDEHQSGERAAQHAGADANIGARTAYGEARMEISAQQLAELLIGIARAQHTIIQGVESAMAGTKTQHILPMLQNAAHLRDHPEPTLIDLPVRVLLTTQGRVPPDPAVVARDLERLLAAAPSA